MPVVGLKVLDLSWSNLGLLFTSMGAGSVVGAAFIIPWLRARLSPDCLTLSANLLLVLVYVLMALVRQTEVFVVVAALAGVGWTMSASELWVAAQRPMPSWARGRLNATVIMISQGAMALWGVIWGSAGAIFGNKSLPSRASSSHASVLNREDRSIFAGASGPSSNANHQREHSRRNRSLPCRLDTRRGCGEVGGNRNKSER